MVCLSSILTCMLSCLNHVRLCDPTDCSPPGFYVHRISRQECWSGLPCPPLRDLPNPGFIPASPALALQVDSLPLSHQGSPFIDLCHLKISFHYLSWTINPHVLQKSLIKTKRIHVVVSFLKMDHETVGHKGNRRIFLAKGKPRVKSWTSLVVWR